jgi:adenylate kinase
VEVDLGGLARVARRPGSLEGVDVVVGHLAHLLPLRDVVVLRCHPLELDRRLRRARRGNARSRRENVEAEVTDVVRWETAGKRVQQLDTTDRTIAAVAREVDRFLRTRVVREVRTVDWLADPVVTDYLLDRSP